MISEPFGIPWAAAALNGAIAQTIAAVQATAVFLKLITSAFSLSCRVPERLLPYQVPDCLNCF
jgi:hypothetical protein